LCTALIGLEEPGYENKSTVRVAIALLRAAGKRLTAAWRRGRCGCGCRRRRCSGLCFAETANVDDQVPDFVIFGAARIFCGHFAFATANDFEKFLVLAIGQSLLVGPIDKGKLHVFGEIGLTIYMLAMT